MKTVRETTKDTKAERNTQRERDRHCHPSVLCALPKAVPSEDLQPKAVLSEDLQQGVPTTVETDFPKTV